MSYRIFWGELGAGDVLEGGGADRRAIEMLLGQVRSPASWAEVFDEHGAAVAHKSVGRFGVTGFPGTNGWGHVCVACRAQVGQNYRYAPAHGRLKLNPDARGNPSYVCRNCGTELGFAQATTDYPPTWGVLTWPDMKP